MLLSPSNGKQVTCMHCCKDLQRLSNLNQPKSCFDSLYKLYYYNYKTTNTYLDSIDAIIGNNLPLRIKKRTKKIDSLSFSYHIRDWEVSYSFFPLLSFLALQASKQESSCILWLVWFCTRTNPSFFGRNL